VPSGGAGHPAEHRGQPIQSGGDGTLAVAHDVLVVRRHRRRARPGLCAHLLHQGAPVRLTETIFAGDRNRLVYELGDLGALYERDQ